MTGASWTDVGERSSQGSGRKPRSRSHLEDKVVIYGISA